jgi:hypothetical protein
MTGTWVFDVDGSLLDLLTGRSLRPLAEELLSGLLEQEHTLILWSAGGADYALRKAEELGIVRFFHQFQDKVDRVDGRYATERFLDDHAGVVFVDDQPEDMPHGADVVALRPYLAPNPHDRGLEIALVRAGLSAASSTS